MSSGSYGAGTPRCAVASCRYFVSPGSHFCASHHRSGEEYGSGAGSSGGSGGGPSGSADQRLFLAHMGLAGVDRQGLTFGELRRFNPNFQDLLGDRVRMWLPGSPASHRLEVAKVLPIVTTVWGANDSATPDPGPRPPAAHPDRR